MPSKTFGTASRLEVLCVHLSELAHDLGPNAKLPTVLQLKQTFGVSITTLNGALRELEAQNVLQRKHGVGIYVSPTLHYKSIYLVCDPNFFQSAGASPFWPLLVEQARLRATAHEETFHFHFGLPDLRPEKPLPDELMRAIQDGKVDGVIGVGLNKVASAWLQAQSVPFVAFAGPARWLVSLDGRLLARAGVQALASQGCTKIGLWRAVAANRPYSAIVEEEELYPTFRASLAEHARPFLPELSRDSVHEYLRAASQTALTPQEQGYHLAWNFFRAGHPDKLDGLISTDDMMTRGILTVMQKLGLRAGTDLQIATHANRGSTVLLGHEDELTRLEIDPGEVVRKMFALLEGLMTGREPEPGTVYVAPFVHSKQTAF